MKDAKAPQPENEPQTVSSTIQNYYETSFLNGAANSYLLQNYFPHNIPPPPAPLAPPPSNKFTTSPKKERYNKERENLFISKNQQKNLTFLSSPIHGHTYFVAAKEEIKEMLGGTFDYGQLHRELSKMVEKKDSLSQKWKNKEDSSMYLLSHYIITHHPSPSHSPSPLFPYPCSSHSQC